MVHFLYTDSRPINIVSRAYTTKVSYPTSSLFSYMTEIHLFVLLILGLFFVSNYP